MKFSRRMGVLSTALLVMFTTLSFTIKDGGIDAKYRSQNLEIKVEGTSTLHDWEMKSNKGFFDMVVTLDAQDKVTGITGLSFTIPAESLKSNSSGLDKNGYKALNTSEHKNISFVSTSAFVTQTNGTTYQFNVNGKLTIAGHTKLTGLVGTARYNPADKSFSITGSKTMKMTDYGVKPPTVMMGTIKTGNEITISFNSKIIR